MESYAFPLGGQPTCSTVRVCTATISLHTSVTKKAAMVTMASTMVSLLDVSCTSRRRKLRGLLKAVYTAMQWHRNTIASDAYCASTKSKRRDRSGLRA